MFNDRNIRALITSITFLVARSGCHTNTLSPVAASTPAALTEPFEVALWTLTYIPVSVTGAACGIETSVGSASTEPMMVELSPQTVDFRPGDPRYWEPFDFFEYT